MLLAFTEPLTKVLVTNGQYVGSKKLEIIDLEDPTNLCQPSFLADYPIDEIQGASGGLLTNNNALICGGFDWLFERLDDCFAINENGITNGPRLSQPRYEAASVFWNHTTLWLTGGYIYNYVKTKSTEFVQLTGTTPGPDLPLEVSSHCLVSLNDTTILLIGGYIPGGHRSNTFFYNTDHKTWTDGPSLTIGRSSHSCALFKSPQHGHTDTVIVTGGYNGDDLASTEYLNLESNSWQSGKGQLNSS
jgi:hypothetical protein